MGDSERLEVVGHLASGVAHEINNFLSVILSFAHHVRKELPLTHAGRGDLDEVVGAAERAQALTKRLLSLACCGPCTPELVNVNELLQAMARMLRPILPSDIVLGMQLEPSVGRVSIDPAYFELLVVNLVINARDAMPQGGRLSLVTRLGASADLVFECVDTGIGMSEQTRARAFERFFTTKDASSGTGLGLATCWDVVTAAGGRIEIVSAPGRGSTFRVHLPLAQSADGGRRDNARARKDRARSGVRSSRARASGP